MPNKTSKKVSHDLATLIPINLQSVLENEVAGVKKVTLDSYEDNLLGVYIPKNSLSDPEKFYDEFKESVDRFEYIETNNTGGKSFNIPDIDTFDFDNILVIKLILEGIAGTYRELPEKDLNTLLNDKGISSLIKRRLRALPDLFNGTASAKDRFTLVPTRGTFLKNIQAALGKGLVNFPFSNSPPLDIFEPVSSYVKDNIKSWTNKAVEMSTDKIKILYR